ncbi:hypothetical protein BD779DRAFT_1742691 [Infundibulicybe gibba]|nr:hypothetical protein BD779DRAFT_1742691 [Infundibulicybe gibba]
MWALKCPSIVHVFYFNHIRRNVTTPKLDMGPQTKTSLVPDALGLISKEWVAGGCVNRIECRRKIRTNPTYSRACPSKHVPSLPHPELSAKHHLQKSQNPHNAFRKTFHNGTTYNELFGHAVGDGLTCGIVTLEGDPGIAATNPYGGAGIITKGVLFFIDSSAPNERHVFREGDVLHVTKGSTYKWGAEPHGEAFYVMPKPINEEVPQSLKKPTF